MMLSRCSRKLQERTVKKNCKYFATATLQSDEYTVKPEYPPIIDVSSEAKRLRKKEAEHDEIKAVKTVEEKQIKLNMPKYYGFKTYLLHEDNIFYNTLPLIQHCTRTHLIESPQLPKFYDSVNVDDADLKSDIEEGIITEFDGYRRKHDIKKEHLSEVDKENIISSAVCSHLNRIIMNKFSKKQKHLADIQIDHEPRIESTWVVGGMDPPENIRQYRRGREWSKPMENESTNRVMAFVGAPSLSLRSVLPLLPVIPYNEAENSDFSVPFFKFDPRVVGTKTEYRHIRNTPGYWPGDPYEFGFLSYHHRGHMLQRKFIDQQDYKEVLHSQGLLSSFAWLNAQANYLGFTTFNDITYPLVTQTIITNGKLWSFYIYQLNTLLIHSKNASDNPKRNICWSLPEMKLFEEIQGEKVIGLNEDVLKTLLKLYFNVPQERLGVNLKPYLDQEVKVSADYEDDEKRKWLEKEFKYLVSGRPRHKLTYELYHWEKIYKVDHPTRVMEPRRRPFELFQKPFDRKLNERKPEYIPRVLRPHLPKNKGRDAKEFFP